jgi:hypothetical protein
MYAHVGWTKSRPEVVIGPAQCGSDTSRLFEVGIDFSSIKLPCRGRDSNQIETAHQ